MDFVYSSVNQRPDAVFPLGDYPFQDYSGKGISSTATSTPRKGVPLVSGIANSAVLGRDSYATFGKNYLAAGNENKEFSMGATFVKSGVDQKENLCVNPTFEATAAPVNTSAEGTTTRSSGWARTGTYSTLLTKGSGYAFAVVYISNSIVPFGVSRRIGFWVNTTASQISVARRGSAGYALQTFAVTPNTPTFIQYSYTGTGGANVGFDIGWEAGGATAGNTAYIDNVIVMDSVSPLATNSYFDGTFYGYRWTGTAHNSTSVRDTTIGKINQTHNSNASTTAGWTSNTNVATGKSLTNMTEDGVTFNRVKFDAGTSAASWRLFSVAGSHWQIQAGDRVKLIFRARGGGGWENLSPPAPTILMGNGLAGMGASWSPYTLSNEWKTYEMETVATSTPAGSAVGYFPLSTSAISVDSWIDIDHVAIIINDNEGEYFDASSPNGAAFDNPETSPSYIKNAESNQKILGSADKTDGLYVVGKKIVFKTGYLDNSEAKTEYHMQEDKAYSVFVTHSSEKNSLYVDGELVDEVEISDEQKSLSYRSNSQSICSGATAGVDLIAVGGVSFYGRALPGTTIASLYNSHRNASSGVYNAFGGTAFEPYAATSILFDQRSWTGVEDWRDGENSNVSYYDDSLSSTIINGIPQPGTWEDSFALDGLLFGVFLDWEGEDVSISASIDGLNWEAVEKTKNLTIIPNGYDGTDKVLLIKATFGEIEGYLDKLYVCGVKSSSVPSLNSRIVSVTSGSLMLERDVLDFSSKGGARLDNGKITLSDDPSLSPEPVSTIEVWMKADSAGSLSINKTPNSAFINGQAGSVIPAGWQIVTVIFNTPVTGDIEISGSGLVSRIVLYPDIKTSSDVQTILNAYSGVSAYRFADNSTVSVSEPATATDIYARDWSISASG